jgi:hypothetical protein
MKKIKLKRVKSRKKSAMMDRINSKQNLIRT